MTYKPVDTAITMVVGPLMDDSDFKSLEEAIAYNAAGMDVSLIVEKTDGTTAVTAITLTTGGTSDWTHKDGGYYEIEITAAQNSEEGIGYVRGVCTGVLPFESIHYNIVKANIYDSWIKGTDILQTDVRQIGNNTTAGGNFEDDYDGTGYTKTNSTVGTCTTNTDMVGTDNAALAATALSDTTWTDAKAVHLDANISSRNSTTPPTVAAIRTEMEGAGTKLTLTLEDTGTTIPGTITALQTDVTALDVLTEGGGSGDLTAIKTQVDAILDLERESGVVIVTNVETTLYEDAAPTKNKQGVVVKIDMAALASGDTFVVKEKYKDESGGAYQEVDSVSYTGAQGKPLRIIELTPYRYGAIITMQRTAGTNRSIEWESFVGE